MSKLKLWLDDVRPMPDGFDIWCTTAKGAIECLTKVYKDQISFISFDHDLGPIEAGTGYDVACFIEQAAFDGTMNRLSYGVHSANPVGRKNIQEAMAHAIQFWEEREEGRWK